jgi:hypothetical protein
MRRGLALLTLLATILVSPRPARAWGRHDLITMRALRTTALYPLQNKRVAPEPIEMAAPDLLSRAMPEVLAWARRYQSEYDTSCAWAPPIPGREAFGRELSPREELLWQLEDNIDTPLGTAASPRTAAAILARYVEEPDSTLDAGFNVEPYLSRLRERMSLFFEGGSKTHAFRHFYVPSSLIPPLLSPRGMSPYRAALYARLSAAAFRTGHPYWGFRFLAWSLHYAQDTTQPWHTVFVPDASFLHFSKSEMRKEISAHHYLTEALADALMLRTATVPRLARRLSQAEADDWEVAKLVKNAALRANSAVSRLAALARPIFDPVIARLDLALAPTDRAVRLGGVDFPLAGLDFTGSGAGAASFLAPLWDERNALKAERDALLAELDGALERAEEITVAIVRNVFSRSFPERDARPRPPGSEAPITRASPERGAHWERGPGS